MPSSGSHPPQAPANLSLWDAVSIIVGIVIGAGIYETAPFILSCVASPNQAMLVWALGGVLSVIGALCYAELATTYPKLGGDYFFLQRAYGPWAGFLFGWSQLTVIMTGSIGMMAYVFADYAVKLFGTTSSSAPVFAAAAVVLLSITNIVGVKSGRRTQNVLTLLKVIGLTAIVVAGFFAPAPVNAASSSGGDGPGFQVAMILVLYTYGGWNDAAFVVAEMKDKRRSIPQALLIGTASVAIIYLLINAAYMSGLGFDGARNSKAIAADVLQNGLGNAGAKTMSILVLISALGALNGLILTGARIYAAVGTDYPVIAPLARWHPRLGTPVASLLLQMAISLGMVLLVGTEVGRSLTNGVLGAVGFAAFSWEGHGGFDSLLRCTAPIFWLFFLLTGISLFVLRVKDRGTERPFSVPLFPILPLIFCGMCAFMLYSATTYAGRLTLLGTAPVGLGMVVLAFCGGLGKRSAQAGLPR
jgi:amino acid transporter